MLELKGVHGTCRTFAELIQKKGFNAALSGRAGSGLYLWAYSFDATLAQQYAFDWYQDKLQRGGYANCARKDYAQITVKLKVAPEAYLNLNRLVHQEQLYKNYQVMLEQNPQTKTSEVFDSYIKQYNLMLKSKGHGPVKVIETLLPFPSKTKSRLNGPSLTVGASSYIVSESGLGDVQIEDVFTPRGI